MYWLCSAGEIGISQPQPRQALHCSAVRQRFSWLLLLPSDRHNKQGCLPRCSWLVAAQQSTCSPYWCPSTALLRRTTRVLTGAITKGAPHIPTGRTL